MITTTDIVQMAISNLVEEHIKPTKPVNTQ